MTLKSYAGLLAQIKKECLFDGSFRDETDVSTPTQTVFVCVCLSLSALQELLSARMMWMMCEQDNMLKD